MPPPRENASEHKALAHARANGERGFPWLAVAASLAAHAVVFALLLNAPVPTRPAHDVDRVITMRLATHSTREPAPEVETGTPPTQPPPQDQPQAPDDPETAAADPGPANPAKTPRAPEPDTAASETKDSPVRNPAGLRARILEQLGARPAAPETEETRSVPWAATGEAVPGLPGTRGWIAGFVGRVAPRADTWKANDGSSRGRYVLADGTVVCTRRRAATVDESMNPWKSTVVTMAGTCGRARPKAPDFTDPRVQPPPGRIVENTPGLDD